MPRQSTKSGKQVHSSKENVLGTVQSEVKLGDCVSCYIHIWNSTFARKSVELLPSDNNDASFGLAGWRVWFKVVWFGLSAVLGAETEDADATFSQWYFAAQRRVKSLFVIMVKKKHSQTHRHVLGELNWRYYKKTP